MMKTHDTCRLEENKALFIVLIYLVRCISEKKRKYNNLETYKRIWYFHSPSVLCAHFLIKLPLTYVGKNY